MLRVAGRMPNVPTVYTGWEQNKITQAGVQMVHVSATLESPVDAYGDRS